MTNAPLQNVTPDGRPASSTAWGVMILRAVHQLLDEPPPILADPVAQRLAGDTTIDAITRDPERFRTGASMAIRGHVVTRSRYSEDRLASAVGRGVNQCVILGAGYDTFAYRQPAWAAGLRIFEVDQPASQQAKRDRLRSAGIDVPGNVIFAAIDFENESLEAGLRRSGFDPAATTFISCLGVLVYLTAEAVESIFRFAVSLPRGSEIVCTFRARRHEGEAAESPAGSAAAAVGEPWISQFEPDELAHALREMGFSDVAMITGAELDARYAARRRDGVHPPRRMMMVSAVT